MSYEGAYLPYRIATWMRERMAMSRHRRLAEIGSGTRILCDGWLENPTGSRGRIIIGPNTIIRGQLLVFRHGGRIRIGEWCFVGHESYLWSAAAITVGNRCLISHNVNVHDTDGHSLDARTRHQQFRAIATVGHPVNAPDVGAAPIIIEDDAWLGYGSSLLKGVRVGEGAIVAAAAVVTRDVAPWTVVAGNPARIVRELPRVQGRSPEQGYGY